MPELDGFELAAMIRQHPRCRQDRDHLRLGGPPDRRRPVARLRNRRRRLRVGARRAGDPAREGRRLPRSLPEDDRARAPQQHAGGARGGAHGRTRAIDPQLRESEDRLRQQSEALAEADRRKNEFLAMLAHELRNPLQPIRTAVELCASATDVAGRPALEPDSHRAAGQPARAARRRSARRQPHQQRQARAAKGGRRAGADPRRRRRCGQARCRRRSGSASIVDASDESRRLCWRTACA